MFGAIIQPLWQQRYSGDKC